LGPSRDQKKGTKNFGSLNRAAPHSHKEGERGLVNEKKSTRRGKKRDARAYQVSDKGGERHRKGARGKSEKAKGESGKMEGFQQSGG